VAGELLTYQKEDGQVTPDYGPSLPVAIGALQTTYQAAQTWRQAYARTADDKWLPPIQRAEAHLQQTARTLHFAMACALVIFLAGHVAMVVLSGFRVRMRGMITGRRAMGAGRA